MKIVTALWRGANMYLMCGLEKCCLQIISSGFLFYYPHCLMNFLFPNHRRVNSLIGYWPWWSIHMCMVDHVMCMNGLFSHQNVMYISHFIYIIKQRNLVILITWFNYIAIDFMLIYGSFIHCIWN